MLQTHLISSTVGLWRISRNILLLSISLFLIPPFQIFWTHKTIFHLSTLHALSSFTPSLNLTSIIAITPLHVFSIPLPFSSVTSAWQNHNNDSKQPTPSPCQHLRKWKWTEKNPDHAQWSHIKCREINFKWALRTLQHYYFYLFNLLSLPLQWLA